MHGLGGRDDLRAQRQVCVLGQAGGHVPLHAVGQPNPEEVPGAAQHTKGRVLLQLPNDRGAEARSGTEPDPVISETDPGAEAIEVGCGGDELTARRAQKGRRIDRALGPTELPSYVAGVAVAAEVLDSRWTGYRFRLADVLADATSAAGFVLGSDVHEPGSVGDLAALRGEVRVDGELVEHATGAAVLGDPLRALVLLSERLAARGDVLPEGSWVLAGALTDAVPLVAGCRYELELEALGTIRLDAR